MAFAVPVRALSAATRARLLGGSKVGIGGPSVRGLSARRWGSAVGDICRRCRPLGSVGLPSMPAWKVTCPAAEGGVRPLCWAFADLPVPRGGCGFRGECRPAAPSGACWSKWLGWGWAPLRITWGCYSSWSSVRALRVAGVCYLPRGPLGRWGPLALVSLGSVWRRRAFGN